jgi:hydrogenase maturation protease
VKPPRILVAGIGNIFLGDDAFGCEVAQRLLARPRPDAVQVRDFGIRGLDLAYTLLDGVEFTILIDAMPRGGEPGTIYLLEPELDASSAEVALEGHDMNPAKVLHTVRALGGSLGVIRIVGCEPAVVEETDAGLSAPVKAAVDGAVTLVESLVHDYLATNQDRRPDILSGQGPAGQDVRPTKASSSTSCE